MASRFPRVLMIAFHYPPCSGSSGPLRTLCFSRHLPAYGWQPVVLTVSPRAYTEFDEDKTGEIPPAVPVCRALGLDTARHLAIGGKYFRSMALPDRWVSWALCAVPLGLWLARKYRPTLLWSTYPIATAHLIGFALHRLTGIPWITDFRDPMLEENPDTGQRWPSDPAVWRARQRVERNALRTCARAVFVAPGALRICARRYPDLPHSRWALIGNGYDETAFVRAESHVTEVRPRRERLLLVHSGYLYPGGDRDPNAFFSALAQLHQQGSISPANFRVVLRASGFEDVYRKLISAHGLGDIVFLKPSIPHVDALVEMLQADGLLLFQGRDSNPAIPAKLYEYLRARRPILAMTDASGDTARELQRAGVGMIVPLDQADHIARGLLKFLEQIRESKTPLAKESEIQNYSRESKARELAQLLDTVASSGTGENVIGTGSRKLKRSVNAVGEVDVSEISSAFVDGHLL